MPVARQVQDIRVDLLGQPAARDAEQFRDLFAGERGLPGPQEEFARLPVKDDIGDRRLDEPAVLTDGSQPLVVKVALQLGAGEVELSELQIAYQLSHAAPYFRLSPARSGRPSAE